MNTTVSFRSQNLHAIDVNHRTVGLDELDKARDDVGACFDMCLMQDYISCTASDLTMHISEDVARESNRYANDTHINVRVPARSLNRFISSRTITTRELSNDAIALVEIVDEIDNDAIIEAWKTAGYPIVWNPAE